MGSDVCSNAIRVVKTKVQTSPDEDTNPLQAARAILEEDGVEGLFFRGLETRLTINCLQGAVHGGLEVLREGARELSDGVAAMASRVCVEHHAPSIGVGT